eukprot:CAMPEP_0168680864 /NCGR_PEP_ID=MMETSP0503-20121227/26952_1 /TAXON_ID=89963 /ORGANISM="Heterocapsa rotundata, Strain SCCAP K-0483" /LENGTH=95 /DNA_ID=CAMNT_0008725399 /DNA_START=27 /DNA_END=310 /DNA_ORIENTATION=+
MPRALPVTTPGLTVAGALAKTLSSVATAQRVTCARCVRLLAFEAPAARAAAPSVSVGAFALGAAALAAGASKASKRTQRAQVTRCAVATEDKVFA